MKNRFQKLLSICIVLMFVFSLLPTFAAASTLAVSSYWMESGSKNLAVEQGKNAEFAFVILSAKKFDYQADLLGSDGKAIETLAFGEKMNANMDGFFNKVSVETSELKAGEYTILISAQAIDGSDASVLYLTVEGKAALPQCTDGKDNDGDGKVDLQDAGCSNNQDNDEKDALPQSNNKAPILSPVNDMTFVEGESLTFQLKATDENKDKILYSYFISTPGYQTIDKPGLSGASFNEETGVFIWNPGYDLVKHPSKEAVIDLIFSASDGLLKDQDEVKFTVKDTNQNPAVNLVEMTPGKILTEEETLSVKLQVNDQDKDKATLNVKLEKKLTGFFGFFNFFFPNGPLVDKELTINNKGEASFTWTPTKSQSGKYKLTFTAKDAFEGSNSQNVDLTVLDKAEPQVNHAPELENIPDQTFEEGKVFSYQVKATDEDGDKLDYSLVPGTTWLQIDASTGLLKGTADKEGVYEYNVYVSDKKVGDSDKFVITVTDKPIPGNHKPTITSKPVSEGYVNTKYTYDVRALDADKGDKLTYSLTAAPAGMGINSKTGMIAWTPIKEGKYHVAVKVSDGKDSGSQIYTLAIKKKEEPVPENHAPVLNELDTVQIKLGETVSKLVTGYDQDKELLALKILNMNTKGMSLTTAGKNMWLFSWKPHTVGNFPVIFQLSDGKAGVQGTLNVEVTKETPLPENHAPMITSNPSTEATVGETYTYQLTAVDEDEDLITFIAKTSLPEEMSMNGATGEITWTPKEAGEVAVSFVAFDGTEDSAPQEFTIIISDETVIPSENNAPVLKEVTGLPEFYYEGDLVSFYLDAEDIDLNELTLAADNTVGSVEKVGDHTWAFSWQTAKGDAGEYELAFTVSDGQESDSQTVSLKVVAKEEPKPTINKKPYFITVAPTEATLGKTYQYTVKAKDPEGEIVALSLKTGPEGMEMDTNSMITWKVEKNGQFKVVIEAYDGEMLEQQVYYIMVGGQNNKLGFDNIYFEEDEVSAGDSLIAKVDIVNSGYQKMKDVTITLSIPELGIKKISGLFDIKKNKQISKQISLELPEGIDAGEYDVKITVSNDLVYNVAYRTVDVK